MNFYFDADIFRGKKAGIYRYSKEICQRFNQDSEVDCKFVSSSGLSKIEFLDTLQGMFGEDAKIYERYCQMKNGLQEPFDREARDKFRRASSMYSQNPNWSNKINRELARLFFKFEERKLSKLGARFYFDGEHPIVFAPHSALADSYFCSPTPVFKVQVIYDLIPVLYRNYFDNTRAFDNAYETLDRIDLVVTISESTRNDLLRLRPELDPEKVCAVPLAASDHFVPVSDLATIKSVKEKYGIPADSDYIFTVSTVEPRKNQLRLVEAWAKIYGNLKINKPKLVIAGGRGWGHDYLAALEGHDEIDKTVIFTGYVDDEDLPVLYSGSVVTAYPSLYEGFGIPVLESMACGKFCVTSNVSSIPEIVGSDYPLVDPESVDEIAQMLEKGVNDQRFRREMEVRGIDRARLFNWDNTYQKTKQIIAEAASKYFESI